MSFNQVILHGNITRDPELQYTPSGTAVCKIGLALNRKWKSPSGEDKEEVTFVDCTAFGRTAEVIAEYFKKGGLILVQGRLKLDQWDDKNTGERKYKLHVVIESFDFSGKNGGGEGQGRQQDSRKINDEDVPRNPAPRRQASAPPADSRLPEDDDVPF